MIGKIMYGVVWLMVLAALWWFLARDLFLWAFGPLGPIVAVLAALGFLGGFVTEQVLMRRRTR